MSENQPNTDDITEVDKTKYNTVFIRQNRQWIMSGYECKTCLSRLKKIGRLLNHHEFCKGKPLSNSQRKDY